MSERQQSVFFCLMVFLFASGVCLLVYKNYNEYYQEQTAIDLQAASTPSVVPKAKPMAVLSDGRLQVNTPKEGDLVGGNFKVSGLAQGWFEGTINIKVFDDNNNLLFEGNSIAPDNSEHPAAFETSVILVSTPKVATGRIEFDDYSAKDGSLTYQKVVHLRFSSSTQSSLLPSRKNSQNL